MQIEIMMENGGWYFPASFEEYSKEWVQHSDAALQEWTNRGATGGGMQSWGTQNGIDKGSALDIDLETDPVELLVATPLEHDVEQLENKTKKKKKKRKNFKAETFHDKYTISSEELGRGAHSLVAMCVENETQKQYAVKMIEKYEGYDRSRVLREIDVLHFLADCPNVLHLYDAHEESNEFFLVFERMEGGPLLAHIQNQTHFTEKCASMIVSDIANALKFLHDRGISHRDLKPDNILCVQKDKVNPVVICDFNLASGISMIGSATTPDLYTPVGSAEFMAPEVVDAFVGDAPAYDKRCDLWSLGVILYIMLSGKPPFTGDCGQGCEWQNGGSCRECQSLLWHNILDANYSFPEEDWQYVSREAKDLILHLLVKEASKRYTVDSLLNHPWFDVVTENELNTPANLTRSSSNLSLSNFASEAVAYRRIISERHASSPDLHNGDDADDATLRWSTPPNNKHFGLSPPGKSRLAKRRSLKNELKLKLGGPGFSGDLVSPHDTSPLGLRASAIMNHTWNCGSLSPSSPNPGNKTPVQSPCTAPNHLDMRLDLSDGSDVFVSSSSSLECRTPRAVDKFGVGSAGSYSFASEETATSSEDVTPEMTPRDEQGRDAVDRTAEEKTSMVVDDSTPRPTPEKISVRKKLDVNAIVTLDEVKGRVFDDEIAVQKSPIATSEKGSAPTNFDVEMM